MRQSRPITADERHPTAMPGMDMGGGREDWPQTMRLARIPGAAQRKVNVDGGGSVPSPLAVFPAARMPLDDGDRGEFVRGMEQAAGNDLSSRPTSPRSGGGAPSDHGPFA